MQWQRNHCAVRQRNAMLVYIYIYIYIYIHIWTTFTRIYNSIHIMNVYECNGTNIFMRWKRKCSIQLGFASLNGTFHLSSWIKHFTFHRMKIFVPLHEWKNIHYLFYITAKWIFFSKTKLTMFSQNVLRCNRGKLWTHRAWLAYSARVIWICFTHSQLRLGMTRT